MTLNLALNLILFALASWRLAVLFVLDGGPFDIFGHLRKAAFRNGRPIPVLDGILSCVGCCAFYTVLVVLGLWELHHWPVEALAVWGGATALHRALA